jgi:prepilin-type processing-associated H-X9-DG protein
VGFSLINLLTVCAILFISGLIMIQAQQSAREAARRAQCVNNMKQIGLALANYESAHGSFPPGGIQYQESPLDCSIPNKTFSAFALILPNMEQQAIWNAINFNWPAGGTWFNDHDAGWTNRTALISQIMSYVCPSDFPQTPYSTSQSGNGYGQCSYAMVAGIRDIWHWYCGCPVSFVGGSCAGGVTIQPDGVFGENWTFRLSNVTDGTSNTMFSGEFARFKNDPDQIFNTWSRAAWFGSNLNSNTSRPQGIASTVPKMNSPFQPNDVTNFPKTLGSSGDTDGWAWVASPDYRQLGQFGFRSQHPAGANFLFGDGSVRFIKETIDMGTVFYTPAASRNIGIYRKLSTKAGGEVVPADAF